MQLLVNVLRSRQTALLALAFFAMAPRASAQDLRLSWDDCDNTVNNKSFSCGTTDGEFHLHGSVVPPQPIGQIVAIGARVVIFSVHSPWWDFTPQGCRASDWQVTTATPGAACAATGNDGVVASKQASLVGDYVHLVTFIQFLQPRDYAAGEPSYVFTMNFQNSGVFACDGCCWPACIQFLDLELFSASGPAVTLHGDFATGSVTWQGGTCGVRQITAASAAGGGCTPTPTRPTTWGQVKALYR